MIRFFIRLATLGLIAGAASFWASGQFSSSRAVQNMARMVAPAVAITELVGNPARYEGSTVQISGRQVPRAKIAALGLGGFVLEDDAGNRIIILVKSGIPQANSSGTITVVGLFRNLFEVGTFAYPVLVVG
jgi:hypothetical protein